MPGDSGGWGDGLGARRSGFVEGAIVQAVAWFVVFDWAIGRGVAIDDITQGVGDRAWDAVDGARSGGGDRAEEELEPDGGDDEPGH